MHGRVSGLPAALRSQPAPAPRPSSATPGHCSAQCSTAHSLSDVVAQPLAADADVDEARACGQAVSRSVSR